MKRLDKMLLREIIKKSLKIGIPILFALALGYEELKGFNNKKNEEIMREYYEGIIYRPYGMVDKNKDGRIDINERNDFLKGKSLNFVINNASPEELKRIIDEYNKNNRYNNKHNENSVKEWDNKGRLTDDDIDIPNF